MKLTIKQLTTLAVLIALEVILSRFFSVTIANISKVSFSFVATGIMAVYFGPKYTLFGCVVADLIGATLFPSGPFFPGFTISAGVTGFIYGLFLFKQHFSWWRILMVNVILFFIITLGLNPLWLMIMFGESYKVLALTRIPSALILIGVEVLVFGLVQKYLLPKLKLDYIKN